MYTKYHPVFLDLNGRPVLIVGGGNVAVEKLHSLLPSGANITVLAPEVRTEVATWVQEGAIRWVRARFRDEDVEPYFMIIAATDDPVVNRQVFLAGNARLRLTNSVDDPINCNFIMAAMTGHGPMQVAISSAGCSPALAQRVRNRIAHEILTPEIGMLAEYLGEWRPRIKASLPSYKARQGFWERVIESPIPDSVPDREKADAQMEAALAWGAEHPDCLACGARTGEFRCVCRPEVD